MANKITVDIETGYLCPDNNQLEVPMRLYRIDRYNRTHRALSMECTIVQPLDETTENTYFVERLINGAWKPLPTVPFQKDPCYLGLKYAKEMVVEMGKALGLAHPDKCPIPAGNYSLHRWPFKINSDSSLPFWPGKFRYQMVWRRIATKQKILCWITIVNFREIVE